jgi:3-methyladenine DNA glycosylase AlkD
MSGQAVRLRRELRALADPRRAAGALRYFKTGRGEYGEGQQFLGLPAPMLHRFAREYQDLPLAELARFLKSEWHEERALALLILVRRHARADARQRAAIHRFYLRHLRYVDNWDLVDCSAAQLVGAHVTDADRALLVKLARSRRVWDRRVAMIATLHGIKRDDFAAAFDIAERLRDDPHDLIHKAVGWMLREVGKRDRAAEQRFLDRHAGRMPRTALRYAIERFPPALRARYLAQKRS